MVQLIKPTQIIERITTQTVQGEITVNLNLTIKIDQDGTISVKPDNPIKSAVQTNFEIPDFQHEELLANFGKDINR